MHWVEILLQCFYNYHELMLFVVVLFMGKKIFKTPRILGLLFFVKVKLNSEL